MLCRNKLNKLVKLVVWSLTEALSQTVELAQSLQGWQQQQSQHSTALLTLHTGTAHGFLHYLSALVFLGDTSLSLESLKDEEEEGEAQEEEVEGNIFASIFFATFVSCSFRCIFAAAAPLPGLAAAAAASSTRGLWQCYLSGTQHESTLIHQAE